MEILRLNQKNLKEIVGQAAGLIKKGKVIVCPTDTVYGLVADASSKKAVGKVFRIKKRKKEKPVPVFVKDLKAAKRLAEISKEKEEFLKKVWPGKVTVVLERKQAKLYGVDKKTVALRIPKYKLVNELLEELKSPLTGTSANISGKPYSTKIKIVLNQFKGRKARPDLVIDAGDLQDSPPSKVVDLTAQRAKVLRKGIRK